MLKAYQLIAKMHTTKVMRCGLQMMEVWPINEEVWPINDEVWPRNEEVWPTNDEVWPTNDGSVAYK